MASQYFVLTDGIPQGPLSSTELRKMATEGILTLDSLIAKERTGPWLQVRALPKLACLLPTEKQGEKRAEKRADKPSPSANILVTRPVKLAFVAFLLLLPLVSLALRRRNGDEPQASVSTSTTTSRNANTRATSGNAKAEFIHRVALQMAPTQVATVLPMWLQQKQRVERNIERTGGVLTDPFWERPPTRDEIETAAYEILVDELSVGFANIGDDTKISPDTLDAVMARAGWNLSARLAERFRYGELQHLKHK